MAQVQDISFYLGEAVTLTFTMDPVESVAGWNVKLTVKNDATDADADKLLQVSGTLTDALNGEFQFAVTHAQTVALGVGQYAYDVQRVDNGSEVVLSIGTLYVTQEVLY